VAHFTLLFAFHLHAAAADKSLHSAFQRKSRAAAWFVSHCSVFSKRQELVRKLQQYVGVDTFGKCGALECPMDKTAECSERYKFYLSFENALCEDYVTEKLFGAMNSFVIPVVFNGAVNMSHFLPPKSYINANDFSSVDQLGLFLRSLMRNETEYLSYFWWRQHYRVETKVNAHAFCDLCKKLNENNVNNRIQYYKSIKEWWTKDVCVNARIRF
jgi:alpha-1,3-fucosyltransferase